MPTLALTGDPITPADHPPHRVRELREAAGLSQRDLARRLGWSHAEVAKVELGHRRLRQEHLDALAPVLGATPAEVLGRAGWRDDAAADADVAARIERLEREVTELRKLVAALLAGEAKPAGRDAPGEPAETARRRRPRDTANAA